MSKEQESIRQLIEKIDEVLKRNYWDDKPFLRLSREKILHYRSRFSELLEEYEKNAPVSLSHQERLHCPEALTPLFVVLFSSAGQTRKHWQDILAVLPKNIFSRPLYLQEDQALEFIRSKEHPLQYAYARLHIPSEQIILGTQHLQRWATSTPSKHSTTVRLKDNSIQPKSLVALYHGAQTYWIETDGELTLAEPGL